MAGLAETCSANKEIDEWTVTEVVQWRQKSETQIQIYTVQQDGAMQHYWRDIFFLNGFVEHILLRL
jgi:hypothetical protein